MPPMTEHWDCPDCGKKVWASSPVRLEKAVNRHVCKPSLEIAPPQEVKTVEPLPNPEDANSDKTQEQQTPTPPPPQAPNLEPVLAQLGGALTMLAQTMSEMREQQKAQQEKIDNMATAIQWFTSKVRQQVEPPSQTAPQDGSAGAPAVLPTSPGGLSGLATVMQIVKAMQPAEAIVANPATTLKPLIETIQMLRQVADMFHQNDAEVARTTAMIFQQAMKGGATAEGAAEAIISAYPAPKPPTQPATEDS